MFYHLRRASTESIKIPFRKRWAEPAVIEALRSTVPRPRIAIPWAEGVQHDQRLDFTQTPWITTQDRSTLLQKKDLGAKSAEYVLRQMPAEFGYDCSKGEWGAHNSVISTPQYFLETAENAVQLPIDGFYDWLFHSPHSFGIRESTRYQYPKKTPEDLSAAYCALMENEAEINDREEKKYAIIGCLLRSPLVSLAVKVDLFNNAAGVAKRDNNLIEYTELVSDLFDAIYILLQTNDSGSDEVTPEWVTNMTNTWKGQPYQQKIVTDSIIKESKKSKDDHLVKVFRSVPLPNTRSFNSFLRCKSFADPLTATKFARNIQKNMADLNLSMSPGTFVEYYRLLDTTHRRYLTRQMSEWNFAEEGHLHPSTDFHDFTAYRRLVDIVWKETEKERSEMVRGFEPKQDTIDKCTTARSIQKLILTNPNFLPRDEFYDLFIKLKNIEMYYSTREEDVWEAFTSSPLQPLELQLTMLRWAEQQNNFNMAARLYQWLDYHNLARESRMLTNAILVFAERTGKKDQHGEITIPTQMIVIAVKELEYVLDSSDSAGGDPTVALDRKKNIVKMAMNILMRCDYEPSIRDFILSCAIDTRKPPLDNEILAVIVEFAVKRGYMGLTEACFRLERAHYDLSIDAEISAKFGGTSTSLSTATDIMDSGLEVSVTYLYTALAILVVALIFLLQSRQQDEPENEAEPEAGPAAAQRARGPAPLGPGGRRRNFQQRRPQRQQEQEAAATGTDDESDEYPEYPEVNDRPEKIGTKKARKLEEKEHRAIQRKIDEEDRQKTKELKEERHAERMKRLEEEEAIEAQREEEERKREEERLQREQEEYEQMKVEFEIEEEGTDARTEEEEQNLLQAFLTYVTEQKVSYIDAIASEFGLRNVEAVNRINSLMESGDLTGVLDDRGKFIHITQKELESVANWISRKGRVSISEIQKESNRLIKLG